jgi:hypothetical protein
MEQSMGDFKKLKVWEKSHQLALAIYQSTRVFPAEERFGLTRAAEARLGLDPR